MKKQFIVTLNHFVINDGYGVAAPGGASLGKLGSLELLQVLMIFQEMNPIQNFTAEPQVEVQVRSEKYFIRTDLNRLLLYNSRRLHEPALVMEASQIITEIDESAAKERDALLRRLNKAGGVVTLSASSGEAEKAPPIISFWGSLVPWLGVLAVLLALGCVYFLRLERTISDQAASDYSPIKDRELVLAKREALAGLYITGNTPGHHAIVIMASGSIRFMQVNSSGATSEIRDDYVILSGEEGLFLRTSQPGGLIHVESKVTLRYCGETYRRQY